MRAARLDRAGRWINAHPKAATARLLPRYDLVPNLSPRNLTHRRIAKGFLRKRCYVRNDFDVDAWTDSSYLEEALASLPR